MTNTDNLPLVSIIIPCYNHEKYLIDCLESIANQTYDNIELIIIDDCSKDNSYSLLQSYIEILRKRFRRVFINRNQQNEGITKTLNKAIGYANGKYYKILASDDMLFPKAIEKLIEFYEKHPEFAIVYSNGAYIDDETNFSSIIYSDKYKVLYNTMPLSGKNLFLDLYKTNFIAAPSVIFKAETMRVEGLFDENLGFEDWEYWLRISRNNIIGFLNYKTVCYRICNNSMTHYAINEDGKKKFCFMLENELKIMEKHNILPICNEIIERYCECRINMVLENDNKEALNIICKFAKNYKMKIPIKSWIKIFLYKYHLLGFAWQFKKVIIFK